MPEGIATVGACNAGTWRAHAANVVAVSTMLISAMDRRRDVSQLTRYLIARVYGRAPTLS